MSTIKGLTRWSTHYLQPAHHLLRTTIPKASSDNTAARFSIMAHKILLLLGAGLNVGSSSLTLFRSQGYRIAAVARTIKPEIKAQADMVLTADFSDPLVMESIFEKVKQKLGVPNVVVYNRKLASLFVWYIEVLVRGMYRQKCLRSKNQ